MKASPRPCLRGYHMPIAMLLGLVAALALASSASAATSVTSDITSSTTWTTAGSPYLIEKSVGVTVEPGATLTIQPGVTVEFNSEKGHLMTVEGTLNAVGTPGSPIAFTSTQGTEGSGSPGQWDSITVWKGSSHFSYANFLYGAHGSGGYRYPYAALTVRGGAVSVAHSTFEHNEFSGLKATAWPVAT